MPTARWTFSPKSLARDPAGDNLRMAKVDPDFDPIRGDPRFQGAVSPGRTRPSSMVAESCFLPNISAG